MPSSRMVDKAGVKGDEVTVTMGDRNYTIRVTDERFTYAYASAGSVHYTTPTDTETGALSIWA